MYFLDQFWKLFPVLFFFETTEQFLLPFRLVGTFLIDFRKQEETFVLYPYACMQYVYVPTEPELSLGEVRADRCVWGSQLAHTLG